MVLEDSDRRVPAFVYWTLTVCGGPFQAPSTNGHFFLTSSPSSSSAIAPHNPRHATPAGYHAARVWAIPVSLATTQGMISFPPATEMFQFADLPHQDLLIQS